MQGKSFTFHEFLVVLWKAKIELIAEKVINDEGIYDIHVIDVLPYKHLLQFAKYLILVRFYENRTYYLRIVWKG